MLSARKISCWPNQSCPTCHSLHTHSLTEAPWEYVCDFGYMLEQPALFHLTIKMGVASNRLHLFHEPFLHFEDFVLHEHPTTQGHLIVPKHLLDYIHTVAN